jgi:hypothetical protein
LKTERKKSVITMETEPKRSFCVTHRQKFALYARALYNTQVEDGIINAGCRRVLHTNKCSKCVSYISLKLYTLKHFHCSYIFR